jgi:tetratricopeptide (TPR) repeat protein
LYKENIEEHYQILSDHFIKAENYEKGDKYCKLICRKAEKTVSLTEAIAFSKKRIECLEKLPQTETFQKKIIDARVGLGLYLMQITSNSAAKDAVAPVIDLALKYDYKKRLCQIYVIEGAYYYFVKEDLPEAFQNLRKAIKVSEEAGDLISYILAHTFLGHISGLNCEFKNALEHFQGAMDIIKKADSKWGEAINKTYRSLFAYNFHGNIDSGFQTSIEGLGLAEESGDILSKGNALSCHGVSCYNKRLLASAEKYFLEGIHLCDQINLAGWNSIAQTFLGETYDELGNYEKSKFHYMNSIEQSKKGKFLPSWVNLNQIAVLRSMVMNNEKDVDLEPIYTYISENKIKAFDGWMRRLLSEILLNMDENHLSDAEDWIRQAIDADQKNGTMFFLAKDYVLYADLFKRKDDIPKARENMTKAIEIFKECGADGWVDKYEKELAAM